ncbi:hypothetical protein, partial [Streptomyces luteolifulvus]|uniref:hypothetical protein n=1 Tax=Streptomyces luteolifulvus TaxID=2615112 RepID=UPI001CD9A452
NGSINFHCSSVSCLRVTVFFLPDPPSRRTRIGKIDHDITQALGGTFVSPVRATQPGRGTYSPSGV